MTVKQAQQQQPHGATENDDVIAMLRDSARDLCARALPRARLRELRTSSNSFDRSVWGQMAELGWPQLLLPESRDGAGLGMAAVVAVCRELGGALAPEPVIESAVGAVSVLAHLPQDGLLQDLLGGGEIVPVAALGSVSSVPFGNVVATSNTSGFLLNGHCLNVPLGADADGWLVPALLETEPAWLWVTRAASGVLVESLPLADGGHDAHVRFSDAPARLLGHGAVANDALVVARARTGLAGSAYLLGLSETLFDLTLEYLANRRQFGQAIGSFQVIQHRMVDLYLQLRLCSAVIQRAVATIDEGSESGAAIAASRACYRACSTAMAMTRESIQLHGAIGTTDECDVGLFVNRALVTTARFGPAAAHARELARYSNKLSSDPEKGTSHSAVDAGFTPPDGDWNQLDNNHFRAVVRKWLEQNYPAELRNPAARLQWQACREWYGQLYRRGWAAPAWPVEHGGMGLAPEKLLIFIEERERWGVARTPDQGIIMIGPLLMQHGSAEQQAFYLPPALSGEHIWCQGYSEPNSGSDLASLATTAVRDGDEFVINGQKIWTTLAQDATHMFCLVRTDPQAKPQAGISFVLIDLTVSGITIRPITNIAGDAEFCEVFFDDVRVPVANLVGALNDGWTIAKALLSFERIFIGSPKQSQHGLSRLHELVAQTGLRDDPVFVDRMTRLELDVADLEALYGEFADVIKRGGTLGADVSVLKIWASETVCRLSEFMLEAAGDAGGQRGTIEFGEGSVDVLSHYYNARPTPIYGGSNEIQRNIVAKHVLRMPSR